MDWKERQDWRNEERRRMAEEERQRVGGGEYREGRDFGRRSFGEDYGDVYRGYEPGGFPGTGGFGYLPSPFPEQRGFGPDQNLPSGYRPNERMFGRGAGQAEAYRGDQERDWWDRAKDEVKSWVGDEDAERRRRMDEVRSHQGRGPKGYARSDDRIREDVSDRLTDDWMVDATNIEVTVAGGEVTLAGTVDSREAKRRAEDCADSVSGVTHVQNNLRIQRSDTAVTGIESSFGASSRLNK